MFNFFQLTKNINQVQGRKPDKNNDKSIEKLNGKFIVKNTIGKHSVNTMANIVKYNKLFYITKNYHHILKIPCTLNEKQCEYNNLKTAIEVDNHAAEIEPNSVPVSIMHLQFMKEF